MNLILLNLFTPLEETIHPFPLLHQRLLPSKKGSLISENRFNLKSIQFFGKINGGNVDLDQKIPTSRAVFPFTL